MFIFSVRGRENGRNKGRMQGQSEWNETKRDDKTKEWGDQEMKREEASHRPSN